MLQIYCKQQAYPLENDSEPETRHTDQTQLMLTVTDTRYFVFGNVRSCGMGLFCMNGRVYDPTVASLSTLSRLLVTMLYLSLYKIPYSEMAHPALHRQVIICYRRFGSCQNKSAKLPTKD